jgi:hypothetical protein
MNDMEQARLIRNIKAAKRILDDQDVPPVEMIPCPFCGGMNLTAMAQQYVECIDCKARGPLAFDITGALPAWHRRSARETESKP